MPAYLNLSGRSGVIFYKSEDDSIEVTFKDHSIYLYNHIKPGKSVVERMKTLASAGSGLNSYISSVVKKNYYKKIR